MLHEGLEHLTLDSHSQHSEEHIQGPNNTALLPAPIPDPAPCSALSLLFPTAKLLLLPSVKLTATHVLLPFSSLHSQHLEVSYSEEKLRPVLRYLLPLSSVLSKVR